MHEPKCYVTIDGGNGILNHESQLKKMKKSELRNHESHHLAGCES